MPARRALERFATETFDVLVIGGGVTGCGVALDAASRGLTVALVEKRDFAAGTSSRSSKLIHGGLRYLENLDLVLVREALARAPPAAREDRSAPGARHAVPLSAQAPRLGPLLHGGRAVPLRRPGRPALGRAAPPPPLQGELPAPRAGAARRRAVRRHPLLRRPDGRLALRRGAGAHRPGPRRRRRRRRARRRHAARRRARDRRARARHRVRARARHTGPGRGQRERRLDDRGRAPGRRRQPGARRAARRRASTSSCPGTASTPTTP